MANRTKFNLPDDRQPPGGRHPEAPDPEPYYVHSDKLVDAVNLAIDLQRPLLLEGEAGCGKSRLARHVAYELGLPFYPWYIRSTSKAEDGFYTYDSILRLHDVQLLQLERQLIQKSSEIASEANKLNRDPKNPKCYLKLGALGKAFEMTDCPSVVLIDEIDKADIDFPNDLLAPLDEWTYEIRETQEKVTVPEKCKPIVIITSNKEKGNLPLPFLRRCIYFYIDFPNDPNLLKKIVEIHYQQRKQTHNVAPPSEELVNSVTECFLKIRENGRLHKKPGTSEFLDWLEALRLKVSRGLRITPDLFKRLKGDKDLPYPELLFKLREDLQIYTTTS